MVLIVLCFGVSFFVLLASFIYDFVSVVRFMYKCNWVATYKEVLTLLTVVLFVLVSNSNLRFLSTTIFRLGRLF